MERCSKHSGRGVKQILQMKINSKKNTLLIRIFVFLCLIQSCVMANPLPDGWWKRISTEEVLTKAKK